MSSATSSTTSSLLSIKVPEQYGYVVLTAVVAQTITHLYLGSLVMKARKAFDVPYPNMYATPNVHKYADDFNRVQRGHQNYVENMSLFVAMALIGGLKHPQTVSIASALYSVGSVLYLQGYADKKLDAETARYKKGGVIKPLSFLAVLGSTISLVGSLCSWW